MLIELTTDDVAEVLSKLVAQPSVSPAAEAQFEYPPYGEKALAELLREMVSAIGGAAEVVESLPGRANFIARFDAPRGAPSLMFEAHADTVGVEGMVIEPFEPVVREGRLYGRGSCDTKGALAAMFLAIRGVLAADGKLPVQLYFASTWGEELGADGAVALVESGLKPDAAVIGEPTGLEIVLAHKGVVRFVIETTGLAAHSSAPGDGINAIYKMRKVIEAIEGPIAEALTARNHELLGPPTISVGTISGGSQVNVVPDRCAIQVDRRMIPGESVDEAANEILAHLDSLKGADSDFEFTYRTGQTYPPFEEDRQSPIASTVTDACTKVLGYAEFATAPWAATSGVFKKAGIPCVLFGPGSIKQAHTREEFIELGQVVKAAQVYAEIIRSAGRMSEK
ncbi:MAG: ArgE/DapE family deacylase [Planctomycetes bacterium]|nr:ArgE/DapE family deacylase [Planctomycetota bacterium]